MTTWIYAGDEEEDFWVVRCNFSKQQGLPTDGLSRMYNTKRASKINCMAGYIFNFTCILTLSILSGNMMSSIL